MTVPAVVKYLWAAPCSLVGVCLAGALLLAGASARVRSGVIEVAFNTQASRFVRAAHKLRFSAITFGHVVLATTHDEHERLRDHERVHVAQYEKWGLLFFVLYPASSVVQLLRGQDPYYANHFEVPARAAEQSRACQSGMSDA